MRVEFQPDVREAIRGLPSRLTLTPDRARTWIRNYPELRRLFRTNPLERPFVGAALTVGEILLRDGIDGEHPNELKIDVTSRKVMEFDRTITSLWTLALLLHDDQNVAYATLTADQRGPNKLSRKTYDRFAEKIRSLVSSDDGSGNLVSDNKKVAMLETGVVIGDLGKSEDFTQLVEARTRREYIDHDRTLIDALVDPRALQNLDEILPSVARLDETSRETLTRVIASGFHSPQLQQAEIRPRQAEGLQTLTQEEVDLSWALGALDIAGAQGNRTQKGAATFTESTVQIAFLVLDAMHRIRQDGPLPGTLSFYKNQATRFGWQLETEKDLTLTQLATMFRYSQPEEAEELKSVFEGNYVGAAVRTIWQDELTRTGYEPDGATMIYYLPTILTRGTEILTQRGMEKPRAMAAALTIGAQLFDAARATERNANSVFVLMANDIVGAIEGLIARNPEELLSYRITIDRTNENNEAWAHILSSE
jgi:hypothetical protein